MSENQELGAPWIKPVSLVACVAVVAIASYFVVTYLAKLNKSFDFRVEKDGNVTIAVSADDSFGEILEKALDKDESVVEAILATKQYFKVNKSGLVDALAHIDPSQPENEAVAEGLRKMLWDLHGPFSLPGTLSGADERLIRALDDLDKALKYSEEASILLTELWELSLDRKRIFRPRFFWADVEMIKDAPSRFGQTITVIACPGSKLVGRMVNLYRPDTGSSIWAEVSQHPSLFDCAGSALTLGQILAGGKVRLGLGESAFRTLVDPEGESPVEDQRIAAKLEVYSKDMVLGLRSMIRK